MKNYIKQIDEIENELMNEINRSIKDLLSIKFSQEISEIVKYKISDIIQNRMEEVIWINELKDNLNTYISEYTKSLAEQSRQLNSRMDFIEQRYLDFMRKVETEYSKKAVFEHLDRQ